MIFRTPSRDRAMDLMREGSFDQALPVLLQLLQQEPRDSSLHYMAGQCCRFTGDLAGAVRHLEAATEQESPDASVLSALGIAHQLAGNLDAAVHWLRRAIEVDPDSVPARNSLGVTFRKMGALSDALTAYDGALSAIARVIAQGLVNCSRRPHFGSLGTPSFAHLMS